MPNACLYHILWKKEDYGFYLNLYIIVLKYLKEYTSIYLTKIHRHVEDLLLTGDLYRR